MELDVAQVTGAGPGWADDEGLGCGGAADAAILL